MEALVQDVNWLAVIVGAILAFMAGWLWYSDTLFGKKWRDGIGIAPNDQTSMMPAMMAQAIGTFLLAWVVGVTAVSDSLGLAVLVALTIAALIKANGFFTKKSRYAVTVETSYILVMVAIMIATHAVL